VTKGIAPFILNSVLDGSEWSVSCPAPWGKGLHFPVNKKNWVGPRAGLDTGE